MNYTLNNNSQKEKTSLMITLKRMFFFMVEEKKTLFFAFVAIIVNSLLNLLGPYIFGYTVDHYIQNKNFDGVLRLGMILFVVYLGAFLSHYVQMKWMGGVGQRVLFKLRNTVFTKLQELPVAFFNQNKIGDLISRINNDTDKLNQFFSETLMRFIGSVFIIIGAAIFVVIIHPRLGLLALVPALFLLIFTRLISPWVKSKNTKTLQAVGNMSSEIQESLNNFKVIVAFNRRDYFQNKFAEINNKNFQASFKSGLANSVLSPVYDLASNAAQLIVFAYGIFLISQGNFSVGLLISFLIYMNRFYDPLKHMAMLWSSLQVALAGWDRVSEILSLETNLRVEEAPAVRSDSLLEFRNISFRYPGGVDVLKHINFTLQKGKTYALVGPTGGGKTTTASLIARLFDPTEGQVIFSGKDLREYSDLQRTQKIGFILQEPFLFTGTVGNNIIYGNEKYKDIKNEELLQVLQEHNLDGLLKRFDEGLDTEIKSSSDTMSLGQRQLVAFMRALLRDPEILILDEATANIDTVTEEQLEQIMQKLPASTTKVIIAHRLNTIENADEIFFINGGEITPAGSMEHALEMLLKEKRQS